MGKIKDPIIRYYTDPLRDDFAPNRIRKRPVEADFPFVHQNPLWRAAAALIYYLIACPLVWLIAKLYLGLRIENRRALRRAGPQGVFLYGNHTRALDAFVPVLAAFPRRAYIVANADAVSIPGIRWLVMMLGGLPLPTKISGMPAFLRAVQTRCAQKACVAIYPEAHIWSFCTQIRPFTAASFAYPVRAGLPAVAMVTTYRKRRGLFFWVKTPAMTVTLSDPFYPDKTLPPKQAQQQLRDQVYHFMTRVSAERENVAYIRYQPRPAEADDVAAT